MKLLCVLAALALAVATVEGIVCPRNYCHMVRCGSFVSQSKCENQQNGIYRKHGTFCGCCPTCLKKLNKGDNCALTLLNGTPPTEACETPLICGGNDDGTVTCQEDLD